MIAEFLKAVWFGVLFAGSVYGFLAASAVLILGVYYSSKIVTMIENVLKKAREN